MEISVTMNSEEYEAFKAFIANETPSKTLIENLEKIRNLICRSPAELSLSVLSPQDCLKSAIDIINDVIKDEKKICLK